MTKNESLLITRQSLQFHSLEKPRSYPRARMCAGDHVRVSVVSASLLRLLSEQIAHRRGKKRHKVHRAVSSPERSEKINTLRTTTGGHTQSVGGGNIAAAKNDDLFILRSTRTCGEAHTYSALRPRALRQLSLKFMLVD